MSQLKEFNYLFQVDLKNNGGALEADDVLKYCNACGDCHSCYQATMNLLRSYTIWNRAKADRSGAKTEKTESVALEFAPRKIGGRSGILTDVMMSNLIARFPLFMQSSDWKRLYKLDEDGCSLITFFKNARDYETTVLLVQDADGWIFGGLITESWKASYGFYGNGDNTLFTFED